ncbi:hypothetical protein [Massilia soli]|uniref:Uncharacterized protein n=1 Tax=Massilia soli TaxID=2792854 RepID=A0ABS7SQK3_9BURK|nr:hypothetical protein [Massilia soli]MBZ2208203.1 hypothetical protein [Massilia soli]
MPVAARGRLTGLSLALCLHAAFVALFLWQPKSLPDAPDPSRMALVWARPVAEAAPASPARPRSAASRPAHRKRAPAAAVPLRDTSAPVPAAEPILESDSADPFDTPNSVVATSFDKAVMGTAIKVAMAERQALEDTQKFVKSGRGRTRHEQFAADVEDATTPYCLGSDSMKHTPPVIDVGGVKIGMGNLLALPFFVKAVATGKCRIK